jgi:DNA-binding winged helix-turn-helix (wHTH) protein
MIYAFDDFELDADQLELRRAGGIVNVDALVLRVLSVLLRGAGQLVSKEQLVAQVWGGRAVADNVITVSVARLRKALDDKRGEDERVSTVYGRGYRFVRPVTQREAPVSSGTSATPTKNRPLTRRASRTRGSSLKAPSSMLGSCGASGCT